MYKTIYVPVDNSDHSNMAVDLGVQFAKVFGSKIVGSHVYARSEERRVGKEGRSRWSQEH